MQRLEHDLYKSVALELGNLMKKANNIKSSTDKIVQESNKIIKTAKKICELMDTYYQNSLKRTRSDDIDNNIKLTLIKENNNGV